VGSFFLREIKVLFLFKKMFFYSITLETPSLKNFESVNKNKFPDVSSKEAIKLEQKVRQVLEVIPFADGNYYTIHSTFIFKSFHV
jgi:hypothetical protein